VNILPLLALAAVVAIMVVELRVSQGNERRLRAEGAVEPAGDVYRWMRFVYPLCFVAMAVEGLQRSTTPRPSLVAGVVVLAASKALKVWAVASLGTNWSFRVLVRPGHVLVSRGPYRYLRHPNYTAIAGEILGMALLVAAPLTGVISLASMACLLRQRIDVEERALGLRRLRN
jgi:methyltransferase